MNAVYLFIFVGLCAFWIVLGMLQDAAESNAKMLQRELDYRAAARWNFIDKLINGVWGLSFLAVCFLPLVLVISWIA